MLYTKELAEQLKEAVKQVEIKVEEDEEWKFDVIATTEDSDRDNETIKVNGWDKSNWEKNPVILANHDYTIQNIIGKGLKFYTSNGQKRLKGVFSKTNPLGVLAKNLYQEGMLKSVSVGFIPLKRNEKDPKIIEKAELLEVSFVAVPANPNATSLDGKLYKEAKEKGFIKEEEEEKSGLISIGYPTIPANPNAIKEEQEEKSPACRQDQAIATANNMCKTDCNEKTLNIKAKDMEEVKKDIAKIKELLKNIGADDKAKQKEEEDLKSKKETIQAINKATSIALENIKKL